MELGFGNGGWVRVADAGMPGPLYVRLLPDERGRLRIRELYLEAEDGPIRGEHLRGLPLHVLEAICNEDRSDVLNRLEVPGPDLSRAASYHATSWGRKVEHWVADSWWAQVAGSGVPQAPRARKRPRRTPPLPPQPLKAPDEGLTDAFLRTVAASYADAVRRGLAPAPTLAEEARVSHRTVHRWVYEARKRGIMPPGKQGRVG